MRTARLPRLPGKGFANDEERTCGASVIGKGERCVYRGWKSGGYRDVASIREECAAIGPGRDYLSYLGNHAARPGFSRQQKVLPGMAAGLTAQGSVQERRQW